MKLGFNEATCMQRSSLEKDLALLEKYGYDYIEIRLDMLRDYLTRNKVKDLQNFFASSRLQPWAFNSIENINFCDAKQWEDLLALFRFGCEMGQTIGNTRMIVVPTMGDTMKDKSERDVFEDSVEVLQKLAEIAKPYGVNLAFEPIGDPRWFVRSLTQALGIVNAVALPEVGLALDSFNLFLYSKLSDIDAIDAVPTEKIFVYHIDDCEDLPLGTLDHCHRLYPGDGVIPLDALSEKLRNKGYDGVCSVELFRPEYWEREPEEVVRVCAEKTRRYL